MPDFPFYGGGYAENTAGTGGVPTGNASANTKGSWTDIVASTAFDAAAVMISVAQASNTLSHLFDVAVGASGSEVIIAGDVLHGGHSRMGSHVMLPIPIPSGTRIAGRVQASTGSAQLQMRATLIRGGLLLPPTGGQIVTMGSLTASSFGTAVDAGAVANTYGSWAQLTASTPADITAICVRIGNQSNASPSDSALAFYLDIGVGAAASEIPVIVGLPFASSSNGSYGSGCEFWFPISIPASTRVAARVKSNITDATDRVLGVSVLGLVV